ncbi:helix-turn-helix domain-containing protein [Isoptericola nanjingensis]|uniref:helix-turn-helix domain-containing protein n=1 Tax=Isoptericola nanjingensis TaxID=903413 RepID=UPI003D2332EA
MVTPTPTPTPDTEPYWDITKAAEFASVDVTTIRRAIWGGRLRAFKVGRVVRIRPADVRAWVSAHPAARPTTGAHR